MPDIRRSPFAEHAVRHDSRRGAYKEPGGQRSIAKGHSQGLKAATISINPRTLSRGSEFGLVFAPLAILSEKGCGIFPRLAY
jgi:hypothetical protein